MSHSITAYIIPAGLCLLITVIACGTAIIVLRKRARTVTIRRIIEFYNNDCGKIDAPTCAGRGVLPREYKVLIYEAKGPADLGAARRITIIGYSIVTALEDYHTKLMQKFPLATIKPLQLIYAQDFVKPHPCQ